MEADAEKSKLLMYVILPAALFSAQRASEIPAVVTPSSVPPPLVAVESVVIVDPDDGVVVAALDADVVAVVVGVAAAAVEFEAALSLLSLPHAEMTSAVAASKQPTLIRL